MADDIRYFNDLADIKARHGLVVVRATWRRGERRPTLILAPALPAAVPDAQPVAEPERKEIDQ